VWPSFVASLDFVVQASKPAVSEKAGLEAYITRRMDVPATPATTRYRPARPPRDQRLIDATNLPISSKRRTPAGYFASGLFVAHSDSKASDQSYRGMISTLASTAGRFQRPAGFGCC
jgi:hypothetical protein